MMARNQMTEEERAELAEVERAAREQAAAEAAGPAEVDVEELKETGRTERRADGSIAYFTHETAAQVAPAERGV